jgi:cytochrome c556
MTWEDVFSKRDYDYLSKVAKGENPYEKKDTSAASASNQTEDETTMDDEQPF